MGKQTRILLELTLWLTIVSMRNGSVECNCPLRCVVVFGYVTGRCCTSPGIWIVQAGRIPQKANLTRFSRQTAKGMPFTNLCTKWGYNDCILRRVLLRNYNDEQQDVYTREVCWEVKWSEVFRRCCRVYIPSRFFVSNFWPWSVRGIRLSFAGSSYIGAERGCTRFLRKDFCVIGWCVCHGGCSAPIIIAQHSFLMRVVGNRGACYFYFITNLFVARDLQLLCSRSCVRWFLIYIYVFMN